MSLDHEAQLRAQIARFGAAWCDPDGQRLLDLHDPARATTLAALEDTLGRPLPPPVRIVFETFDGSILPVSPMRGDRVLSTLELSMKIEAASDAVPLIDLGLDEETGLTRTLDVVCADPWGPLHHEGAPSALTLLAWFEDVIGELTTYVWPAPVTLHPGLAWAPTPALSEAALAALPIGAAIAIVQPTAKRNRLRLALFVQLDAGVWACGHHRHQDDERDLPAMCDDACIQIERAILRAPSQWSRSPADVERTIRAGAARCALWLGAVQIER